MPALAFLALAPVSAARADCIDDAAARQGVDALVLRAIGWQESRLTPGARSSNRNGTIDLGAFQINSVHLPALATYGVNAAALADGCVSAEVAAWHYRRQVERLGDTWQAVGAYHSVTPSLGAAYANRIAGILMQWHALPPSAWPFPSAAARRDASAGASHGERDVPGRAPLPSTSGRALAASTAALDPVTPAPTTTLAFMPTAP